MTTLADFRFPPHMLETKPGPKGRTLTYVDVRNIAAVLDRLAPGWSNDVELSHNGREYAAVCRLTVDGVTRCDVGSGETPPDAANQAFRRAAAAHGLGRYLWVGDAQPSNQTTATHRNGVTVEEDGDILFATPSKPSKPKAEPPVWQTWQDVDDLITWALDNGYALAPQHARNALRQVVDTDLGGRLTKANWRAACEAFYVNRIQRSAEKAAV